MKKPIAALSLAAVLALLLALAVHAPAASALTGSMSLNGGAAYTSSSAVTINNSITGAGEMRFRNSGFGFGWSAWESYAASESWVLSTGDGTFGVKTDYATGSYPSLVAIGDFNSDGAQDLATANYGADTVSVLLGSSDGSFGAKTDYATGSDPHGVTVGDLNSDGKQDLVVTNQNANTLSVLLGNGDGSFAAKVDTVTGLAPVSVAVGDFDADGKQDLAVVNANSYSVGVLLGHGDGTFGARTDLPTKFGAPYSVAVGDFNADGAQDLAVAHCNNYYEVHVWLGHGDGTFGARADYGTGQNAYSVAVGDFNADGSQDLVTANFGANTVSVLLGNGDGTFQAKTDYATGLSPYSVAIGDFNADGKQDLATANFGAITVGVLLGNGEGTFAAKTDYASGSHPYTVAIGDFNSDGAQDLATANYGADTVSVLLGNRGGGDGSKTVMAEYRDAVGSVLALSDSIVLDITKPVTTDDAPAGWVNHAVTVTLAAQDALSGVAKLEYKLDKDGWKSGSSVLVKAPGNGSNDGVHTIAYRATDNVGNVSERSCTVRIDTQGPLVTAFPFGLVKRGATASLKYKVSDKYSPSATVTIKVRDLRGRTVATWPAGSMATAITQTYKATIALDRGVYTVEFDAVDLAGNNQAIPGFAVLIVY